MGDAIFWLWNGGELDVWWEKFEEESKGKFQKQSKQKSKKKSKDQTMGDDILMWALSSKGRKTVYEHEDTWSPMAGTPGRLMAAFPGFPPTAPSNVTPKPDPVKTKLGDTNPSPSGSPG